ncbi:unnamed protein product [Prorocentrum cordatum]|uniref:C3H1-type domain-containing protein n=1 Tax=Prorocentrum cordatum TaxID=2364126 RepID=A0ABN9WUW0_9DINO|nr:unnamed protein product [Polarella glacialis]
MEWRPTGAPQTLVSPLPTPFSLPLPPPPPLDDAAARAEGAARLRRARLASWCRCCEGSVEPGDAIFPVAGGRGPGEEARRSGLSWIHLGCAEAGNGGTLPPRPVCKHFVRAGRCQYAEACFFAHPEGRDVEAARRAERRREAPNQKVANRGEGRRNHVKNDSRVSVLRRWLLDQFGLEHLRSRRGVLDVAGGKGELAWELVNLNGVPACVLEPRPARRCSKAAGAEPERWPGPGRASGSTSRTRRSRPRPPPRRAPRPPSPPSPAPRTRTEAPPRPRRERQATAWRSPPRSRLWSCCGSAARWSRCTPTRRPSPPWRWPWLWARPLRWCPAVSTPRASRGGGCATARR